MTKGNYERSDGQGVNARLGRLEQITSRLEAHAEGTDHKLDHQSRVLEAINTKLDRRTEPNWGWILAGVMGIITVGQLSLSPIREKIADMRMSQRRQWDRLHDHMSIEGHKPMMIRVAALEKAVDRTRQEIIDEIKDVDDDAKYRDKNTDEVVQREMRILDSAMQSKFDKEDERLQREMDLKDDIVSKQSLARHEKTLAEIQALRDMIARIDDEQVRRAPKFYSHNGSK